MTTPTLTLVSSTSAPVSDKHRAAREWAERGWPVFPCVAGAKRPATHNGFKARTTDLEQIDAWWAENPDLNIGFVPDEAGLCVIDLDGRDGEDRWVELDISHGLTTPDTLGVKTPHGRHLYFRGALPPTASALATHVDTRGRDSYVLLPPSTLSDGGVYVWEDERDPADLPAWIVDTLERDQEPARPSPLAGDPISLAQLEQVLSFLDPDAPRSQWIAYIAGVRAAPVPDDPDEAERRELAHRFSRGELDSLGRYRTQPPGRYTGPEAVDEAFDTLPPKAGGVSVGTLVAAARDAGFVGNVQTFPEKWLAVLDEPGERLCTPEPPARLNTLGPVPWRTVRARPDAPVAELVPDLIEKGIPTLLCGPGGSGKSRLGLQLGLLIHAGLPVFGRAVERAEFVYISYEDPADEVARRVHALARRLELPEEEGGQYWDCAGRSAPILVIRDSGEIERGPLWEPLCEHLKGTAGHKLVLVDSCYNAFQFQGRSKIDEGAVMSAFGRLQQFCADTDSTLVVLWHPSQAGMERGDASGFSVAWHNAPRARLSLTPAKDRDDCFELKVEKRNHGPKGAPITLHWNSGALLPSTDIDDADRRTRFRSACVRVAIAAAEAGTPIQKQRRLNKWMLDEIERDARFRPSERDVKEELASALRDGQVRFLSHNRHHMAGYYPADLDRASDLAREAQQMRDGGDHA
jgi:hypothetical protein